MWRPVYSNCMTCPRRCTRRWTSLPASPCAVQRPPSRRTLGPCLVVFCTARDDFPSFRQVFLFSPATWLLCRASKTCLDFSFQAQRASATNSACTADAAARGTQATGPSHPSAHWFSQRCSAPSSSSISSSRPRLFPLLSFTLAASSSIRQQPRALSAHP